MDNIITKIEVQKKNRQRVNIYLDDDFSFGLSIMVAATLCTGQKLSSDTIEALVKKDELARAYNASLRYLGPRARSIAEMKFYLKGKGYSESVVADTISRLSQETYLNDAEFARLWVDSRNRFNPKGAWALKQELFQKGINEAIIEETLSGHDDNAAAWQAVERKIDHWKTLDHETFRKKLYTYLGNRGFSYETTRDIESRIIG